MFRPRKRKFTPNESNNLSSIDFSAKDEVEWMLNTLEKSANNPYFASLVLIASAELGDQYLYSQTLENMRDMLTNFDKNTFLFPENYPEEMQNSSFMAWMWGRIGLAAKSMDDQQTVTESIKKLHEILEKEIAPPNLAFSTWAWGSLAALEYNLGIVVAEGFTDSLIERCAEHPTPKDLAETIWALVLNLSAAASFNDRDRYDKIKRKITLLTQNESISAGIISGLSSSIESTDYPAWALAKVCLAATMMHDDPLYNEINGSTTMDALIQEAQANAQIAEYSLAVIETTLAESEQNDLQHHHVSKL